MFTEVGLSCWAVCVVANKLDHCRVEELARRTLERLLLVHRSFEILHEPMQAGRQLVCGQVRHMI